MTREIDDAQQGPCGSTRALQALIVFIVVLACPSSAIAAAIGFLSFDTYIPGPDGVNSFNIGNLTESFSLPPDFPVVDPLTFLDAELTATYADGSATLIALGDLGSGFVDNPGLLFEDTDTFLSATFTATLSSLQFLLADGSTFEATSNLVSVSLLPSAGTSLTPGVDFVLIDVAGAPVTTVPEPSTVVLLSTGVLAWCSVRRRRMKAS